MFGSLEEHTTCLMYQPIYIFSICFPYIPQPLPYARDTLYRWDNKKG
jgi:hypothetical protein